MLEIFEKYVELGEKKGLKGAALREYVFTNEAIEMKRIEEERKMRKKKIKKEREAIRKQQETEEMMRKLKEREEIRKKQKEREERVEKMRQEAAAHETTDVSAGVGGADENADDALLSRPTIQGKRRPRTRA